MDISRVNTLIVIDSDRFGLSQLYQLRGRVGRSNKIAYAYLVDVTDVQSFRYFHKVTQNFEHVFLRIHTS